MPNETRALTIQRVKTLDVLMSFPPGTVNLLIPETGYLTSPSPFQDILISILLLKPEEAHELKEGKDVRYMPAAPQLNQIANSAGVEWLMDRPVRSDMPGVWKHVAQASYIKANGQRVQSGQMLYVLDLRPGSPDGVEAQVRMQQEDNTRRALEPDAKYTPWALKSAAKGLRADTLEYKVAIAAYVEDKVRREMTMKRRHAAALAQTGAQDRAIRKLFGLKSSYSREEMMKPWVIATSTQDTITMMKELGVGDLIRQRMADRIEHEANVLFGLEDAPKMTVVDVEAEATELDIEGEDEPTDIETDEEPAPEETEEEPATEPLAPATPPNPFTEPLPGADKAALLKYCDGLFYNSHAVRGLVVRLFPDATLEIITRGQADNVRAYVEYASPLKFPAVPATTEAKQVNRAKIDAAKDVIKLAYEAGGVAVFAPEPKAETGTV